MIYAFLFLNDDSVPSRSFQAYTLIEDRNLFEINDIIGFECAIRTKGINSFIKFALKDSLSNEEIVQIQRELTYKQDWSKLPDLIRAEISE